MAVARYYDGGRGPTRVADHAQSLPAGLIVPPQQQTSHPSSSSTRQSLPPRTAPVHHEPTSPSRRAKAQSLATHLPLPPTKWPSRPEQTIDPDLDKHASTTATATPGLTSRSQRPMSVSARYSDPRMDSFSVRSPLQELEDEFTSIETNRAKIEDAERRARRHRRRQRFSRDVGLASPDSSGSPNLLVSEQPHHSRHDSAQTNRIRRSTITTQERDSLVKPQEADNGKMSSMHASEALRAHRQNLSPGRDVNFRAARKRPISTNGMESQQQQRYQEHQHRHETRLFRSRADNTMQMDRASPPQLSSPDYAEAAAVALASGQQAPELSRRTHVKHVEFDREEEISMLQSHRRPRPETRPEPALGSTQPPPMTKNRLTKASGRKSPPKLVKNPNSLPTYQIPPQTAAGRPARDQVGFTNAKPIAVESIPTKPTESKRFGQMLDTLTLQQLEPALPPPLPLEGWRKQNIARLILDDFALDDAIVKSHTPKRHHFLDGNADAPSTTFRPHLFIACGPLLRYTGMRRERRARPGQAAIVEREVWRGSIMIVTQNDRSSYETAPSLRLFAQPPEPLPRRQGHTDLVAGRTTTSRTGRTLYVKPVGHLPHGVDLSRVENDRGLFDTIRYNENTLNPVNGSQSASRQRTVDGEQAGKVRHVNAIILHKERGHTFWRFQIEIELGITQSRVAYRINNGPAIAFWVPARNQTMNIMFQTCNGFSLPVNSDAFSGPDPLWRDVLNAHEKNPYHVMIGGGDQVYSDALVRETDCFREWSSMKNPEHKRKATFSRQMQDELESFYLQKYCTWFSQGLFRVANSQIPMVNMWDDHDIIDGYGSYPHHLMASNVFTGLGAVAFKYYLLFQHQSVVTETYEHESSWLLGSSPGPYINEYSRSLFMFLGRKIALVALDCRTERMRDQILRNESYELILSRCRSELIKGETKHLLVLLGVPIAYPRLNFLENLLTSRAMDPIKAIGRSGALGGFVNKFDGGVEILDDLDEHWTARHHKKERNWFVQQLQDLAAEKSVRVTILGGDVHLAAVGRFESSEHLNVPKEEDHRYMLNVISSAIANAPPPDMMADVLNKRNKVHHLDSQTSESMCALFTRDPDGRPRNNVHLLPRRNYCTISEFLPGSTPRPLMHEEENRTFSYTEIGPVTTAARRYPPGSMSQAAPRGENFQPRNLIRRLSGSRVRDAMTLRPEHIRAYSDSESVDYRVSAVSKFREMFKGDQTSLAGSRPGSTDQIANDISQHTPRGPDANSALTGDDSLDVDSEYGLDIALNVEIQQGATSGATKPYKILVPALWYEDRNWRAVPQTRSRRPSLIDRLRRVGSHRRRAASSEASYSGSEGSETPSPEEWYDDRQPKQASVEDVRPPRQVRLDGSEIVRRHSAKPMGSRRDSQQTPHVLFVSTEKRSNDTLGSIARQSVNANDISSEAKPTYLDYQAVKASKSQPDSNHEAAVSHLISTDPTSKQKKPTGLLAHFRANRARRREAVQRYEAFHSEQMNRAERDSSRKRGHERATSPRFRDREDDETVVDDGSSTSETEDDDLGPRRGGNAAYRRGSRRYGRRSTADQFYDVRGSLA